MLKKQNYIKSIAIVATLILLGFPAMSQIRTDSVSAKGNVVAIDTVASLTDSLSLAIIDTTSIVQDTSLIDSLPVEKSKWDFLTTGGNDSTYYSFYGHLFNVEDTNAIEIWNYHQDVHEPVIYNYDSTLQDFHIYHPAYRNSENNSYLGNMGSAIQSNIFAQPNPETDFIFLESYTPYMFQAKQMQYFNVAKPFTIFKVDIGPKEEQNINILHTQNINKYFNAFLRFKNNSGQGSYIRQETRNNAGAFGASYTKGRLATHFNWVFNRVDVQENGGIVDSYMVTDSSVLTSAINTRLIDGSNLIKDRQLFFDQKIGFLKTNVADSLGLGAYWFSLQYTHSRQKSRKEYEDTDDTYITVSKDTLNLYANNYGGGVTFDSTYFFHKNNNFRINLEENPNSYPFVGAYFGFGLQSTDYYYFNNDTLFSNSHSHTTNSSYFEGGLYRLKGEKFKFSANYKLFVSGYRQNDMQLSGFISQKFGRQKREMELRGEGKIYIETPDYLYTRYNSNHYKWRNSFNAEKRTNLHFSLNLPHYKTKMGTHFSILSDYIYLNTEALPTQYNEAFSFFDVYLHNYLSFGKFGLNTRLNYQQTTNNEILPLPEFSGYAALYWAPNIFFKDTGGKLRFQLGVDCYYWTSYYGPAYSPALARFHNQKTEQIGNYPFVGAFTNFEIKRLRFYIRYEHVNYGITEPRNYFLAPNYPSNRGVLRYGIAWTFYD